MLVVGILLLIAINGALLALVMRFRAARGREPRRRVLRRPAQVVTAGAVAVVALVAVVGGVIEADDAKNVEASGPGGLQAASLITAQRGLAVPIGSITAPLEIRACGQQGI